MRVFAQSGAIINENWNTANKEVTFDVDWSFPNGSTGLTIDCNLVFWNGTNWTNDAATLSHSPVPPPYSGTTTNFYIKGRKSGLHRVRVFFTFTQNNQTSQFVAISTTVNF